MTRLRDILLCLLLGIALAAGIRVLILLDQASALLVDLHATVSSAGPPAVEAIRELRAAAREQRVYSKATAKALALTMLRAGRLVQSAETRLNAVAGQAERTLLAAELATTKTSEETQQLLRDSGTVVAAAGAEATSLLSDAHDNLDAMKALWPGLLRSAEHSAATAANLEHASGSVKAALEPLRRPAGRLRTILRWILGLPKISIL